jgi:hypothetical protein
LLLVCASVLTVNAQITIDDFSSAPSGVNYSNAEGTTWDGMLSVAGGVLTVGGGDATGYFNGADIRNVVPIDTVALDLTQVSVTARIDASHAAPGVTIIFMDGNGASALFATFTSASFESGSFTTRTLVLQTHGEAGNASDIQYYGISGDGLSGQAFRMSFDTITLSSLSAVPEPSTYAAIAGALALGFVAWRRRSVRA